MCRQLSVCVGDDETPGVMHFSHKQMGMNVGMRMILRRNKASHVYSTSIVSLPYSAWPLIYLYRLFCSLSSKCFNYTLLHHA